MELGQQKGIQVIEGQARMTSKDASMRQVHVTHEPIRLGQFLKLAALVDLGSDARAVLNAGEVEVNGVVETRRGRQLHRGDVISIGRERTIVS